MRFTKWTAHARAFDQCHYYKRKRHTRFPFITPRWATVFFFCFVLSVSVFISPLTKWQLLSRGETLKSRKKAFHTVGVFPLFLSFLMFLSVPLLTRLHRIPISLITQHLSPFSWAAFVYPGVMPDIGQLVQWNSLARAVEMLKCEQK